MTSELDHLTSHQNGDWRALLRARVNVLVTGSKRTLDDFVELCRGELRQPFAFASPGGPLPSHSSPTLVITDVPLFDEAAQHALAAWICDPEHANTQVISLASTPLFALVNAGRFDRDLYYRLNVVHFQFSDASTVPVSHPRVA